MRKKEAHQGTGSLYLFCCHGALVASLAFQHVSGEWQERTDER